MFRYMLHSSSLSIYDIVISAIGFRAYYVSLVIVQYERLRGDFLVYLLATVMTASFNPISMHSETSRLTLLRPVHQSTVVRASSAAD
jgi:hypothetical protein